MQSMTTHPSWTSLLEPYREYLQAAGRPKTTINLRVKQIEKVARELAVEPPEVTTDLLARFMGNPMWADNTRATWRASLAGFFRYAHGTGKLDTNPALLLPTVRVPHGQPKPASDSALDHALLYADERTALMVALGSRAGLRCMEIAGLRREHVIKEGKGRYSLRITGKGGKTRSVPIKKDLAKQLLTKPSGPVFPGRIEGHVSAAYVSKLLSNALPPGVTGHKLRHRFATRAYRGSGHNLRAVQQLLGHSSVATTQVYTEVDSDELRQAALSAF